MKRLGLRDPDGILFENKERLLRLIHPWAQDTVRESLSSPALGQLIEQGKMIAARKLNPGEVNFAPTSSTTDGLWLEHRKLPFVSFPHEWAPDMLREAALLTLDIAEKLVCEGLGIKDASARNILFDGPRAVFIDFLSIERRRNTDPVWLPYAQFLRNFVHPLMLNRAFRYPIQNAFINSRDGITTEEVYLMCGPLRRCTPSFFGTITLPTLLGRWSKKSKRPIYRQYNVSPERAKFTLSLLLKSLRKQVMRHSPGPVKSTWIDYAENCSYSREQSEQKRAFVAASLDRTKPGMVLDVGCNTGVYSELAARGGARVVAIDYDEAVVGRLWQKALRDGLDILPLVVNLARPTPGIGWLNQENDSFLNRASGKFDCTLALAVVHHLAVTDGIPYEEILSLFAVLSKQSLVVEFVGPEDSEFQRIALGREFPHLTRETFESACKKCFSIRRTERVADRHRWLYELDRLP